jgi:hypothetical protein
MRASRCSRIAQLDLGDAQQVLLAQRVEDDHLVDAVQELGLELTVQLGLDLLVERGVVALVVQDQVAPDVRWS